MSSQLTDEKGYSVPYLAARRRIDGLCEKITLRLVSPEEALATYDRVEADFLKEEPQTADLFTMIYRSRVKRLTEQFLGEVAG